MGSEMCIRDSIQNVNGMQVGADGKLQHFSGLIVRDDGKVRTVLTGAPPPIAFTRTIDGHGRTLLPGLIDAHGHVTQLGLMAIQLDLGGTKSIGELQSRLRGYAAEHRGSGWIQGRGWNQELWAEKRMPSAADLDAVVPDRPVWLYRVDGHAAVANSAALRAAGINKATIPPRGGEIARKSDGSPAGVMTDTARELVEAKIPPMTDSDMDAAVLTAQQVLLADGITASGHMRTTPEDWASFNRLGRAGKLEMRIVAYAFGLDALARTAGSHPTGWLYADRLQMPGVKFYGDGALGSRGAWLKKPYADAAETSGLSLHSDADLARDADTASSQGFQVAIHAIGDAANAQAIGVYEGLARKHPGDRRWRIEHVQVIDPADIPRLAPAGIIASMQPIHQVSDRLMAEQRLGAQRLNGAYAWHTIESSGARLAFGSDFPFDTPNPFAGLSAAISRQDAEGQPPGGWYPQERLTFEQALGAYTRGAAYAGIAEDRIGALEPGKWADFILIDRDPTKVNARELARTKVLETWVAGKKVWAAAPSAVQPERGK